MSTRIRYRWKDIATAVLTVAVSAYLAVVLVAGLAS